MFHVKQTSPVAVSRETQDRLETFVALLGRWATRVNLVSRADVGRVWERHVEDSLQLVPHMPTSVGSAIDLGSGAGFPGLVLAIATGVHFHLIEADHRKGAFLREAARVTAAPATVHTARIEDVRLPPSALITARALAPLRQLLGFASSLLAPDGVCLFLKGHRAEAEIAEARTAWRLSVQVSEGRLGHGGAILRVQDVHPA